MNLEQVKGLISFRKNPQPTPSNYISKAFPNSRSGIYEIPATNPNDRSFFLLKTSKDKGDLNTIAGIVHDGHIIKPQTAELLSLRKILIFPSQEKEASISIHKIGNQLEITSETFKLEHIHGVDLNQHLKNNLSFEEKLKLVMKVFEKLEQLHSFNIIHRDLKPENIIIAEHTHDPIFIDPGIISPILDDEQRVMVYQGEPISKNRSFKGTLKYMPPSTWNAHGNDKQTDIYTAILIAVEIMGHKRCSGETFNLFEQLMLFQNEDLNELMNKLVDQTPDAKEESQIQHLANKLKPLLTKLTQCDKSYCDPNAKEESRKEYRVTALDVLQSLKDFAKENNIIKDYEHQTYQVYNVSLERNNYLKSQEILSKADSHLITSLRSLYRKDARLCMQYITQLKSNFISGAQDQESQEQAIQKYFTLAQSLMHYYHDIREYSDSLLSKSQDQKFLETYIQKIDSLKIPDLEEYLISSISNSELTENNTLQSIIDHYSRLAKIKVAVAEYYDNESYPSLKADFIQEALPLLLDSENSIKDPQLLESIRQKALSAKVTKLLREYSSNWSSIQTIYDITRIKEISNIGDFDLQAHETLLTHYIKTQEAPNNNSKNLTETGKHKLEQSFNEKYAEYQIDHLGQKIIFAPYAKDYAIKKEQIKNNIYSIYYNLKANNIILGNFLKAAKRDQQNNTAPAENPITIPFNKLL